MSMGSSWSRIVIAIGVVGALCTTAAAQSTLPRALPAIAIEAYPSESRADLEAAYQRALANPRDADAAGALGMLLQAWDQFEAAAAVYAHAQTLAPAALDWWYLGGITASRLALHADAVAQFERADALAGGTPLVSLRLADAQLAAGQLDEAARRYQSLVNVPDCAPAAWYGLGRVHLARTSDLEARAAFEKALELFPAFGAAHYALAQIQRRAGESAAARLSLVRQRQCLACWPMPEDRLHDRVAGLRSDAAALLTRGLASANARTATADADAIRLHEAALDRDITRAQAHVNLIELYGRTGNAAAAEEHYRASLQEPGFAPDAHRAYATVLLSLQKPDEALALLEQAIALSPRDAGAHQTKGLALEMLGRPDEAAVAYSAALQAAPSSRDARFGLARVAMRLQHVDRAIALLEELREPRDAASATYLFALSAAYVRNGQVGVGRRVAHEALDVARLFGDTRTATMIETELQKLQRLP